VKTLTIPFDLARFTQEEQDRIQAAFEFAAAAHEGQTRKSGLPFITHPLAVATTVAEWGMDAEAVMAALLHDTVEDTPATLKELSQRFGETVAELVDGLTKLEAVTELPGINNDEARREATNENLRKLLLASTADVRVLLVKLADRRHNLQTLRYLSPDSRRRIASQSLAVFAPLADRLGMGQLKAELEDLAFAHADPERYREVKQLMAGVKRSSHRYHGICP
jgi:(p)ppGpp synthase/HD superfamily hydrolase